MTDATQSAPSVPTDESIFLWYTVEKGGQAGPWSSMRLRERIAAGKITGDTLVWTHGMSDWKELASLQIFGAAKNSEATGPNAFQRPETASNSEEPSVPLEIGESSSSEGGYSAAPRPWRRWFARIIDLYAVGFVFGVLFLLIGGGNKPNFDGLSFYAALLVFMVVAETFLIAVVGSTLGKSLLNIRVRDRDGTALTWRRSLSRTVGVWVSGEGCLIPIVSLFTMLRQHNQLTANGTTTYDAKGEFRVTSGQVGAVRILILLLAVVAFVTLSMSK